ncbi:hypothetical protein LG634_07680 [Streptomyces bambusae]|uniref:hypothetical protein n=1 Tax=Streptomyces bambusae TaxID=1550616 RepID=UPI001CFE6C7C|nr:hypothetical protein [Streptomyces bambusae]MCB5164714.1 hypothetical protein [Streptomyces bambusae]
MEQQTIGVTVVDLVDESDDCGGFTRTFQWACDRNLSGYVIQEVWRSEAYGDGVNQEYAHEDHYWEVWEVRDGVVYDPQGGALDQVPHDAWLNPSNSSRIGKTGSWSFVANVFWSDSFDPTSEGFAVGNAPAAGNLLSSKVAPSCHMTGLFAHQRGKTWDARLTEQFARNRILFLASDFGPKDAFEELQEYGFSEEDAREYVRKYHPKVKRK